MPVYSFETYGETQPWITREWLQTNGTGGFSSSTVAGCNGRRYHALLVAATVPPVGRIVALSRINETIYRPGRPPIEFAVSTFRQNVVVGHGEKNLRQFTHLITTKWQYEAEGVTLEKELLLCHDRAAVGVRYAIDPGDDPSMTLVLQPFVALRDFHSVLRFDHSFDVRPCGSGCVVRRWGNELHLRVDGAEFREQRDWWYDFHYPMDAERGQDESEDLFVPGVFAIHVTKKMTVTLWAGLAPVDRLEWEPELSRREQQLARPGPPTPTQQRLFIAARDFIATRRVDDFQGTTVLAGYPWFSDWGRDTMIALPGLLLSTGRFDEAGRALCLFARYVSQGMIPNVFNDYTNHADYNTVDASLWFIHACFEYRKISRDEETFQSVLLPACQEIIAGYQHGTRFGIKMDARDGLITQGDPTSQLTWMDAKTNGVVFTPRHGKAVEINALWYNALRLMNETDLAVQAAGSFRREFWIGPFRGLADVINETGRDDSCRPNQIFAVSLPHSPLTPEQQQSVVDVVRRELLTPVGLRTLAVGHPKYQARYTGPQFDRDRAYHNGTIWPWLIGPFLEAYLRVNNRSKSSVEQAQRWLMPLVDSLETGCIGSVSECFESASPHRPVGAFAQAWSVSEVLRLAVMLEM